MNYIIAIVRRTLLGGIISLILLISYKGKSPVGYSGAYLILCPLLYLFFVFITYLKAKLFTNKMSQEMNTKIQNNSYILTLLKAIILDLLSPILVFVDLIRRQNHSVIKLIVEFLIILFYIVLWFDL